MSLAALKLPEELYIETTRFGRVMLNPDEVITINAGLLAFEKIKCYCLLPHKPGSPFRWLQSINDPTLAFVVVNPFEFFVDYEFTLGEADKVQLGITGLQDVKVLTIVTIADKEVSTNLVAPIVLNINTMEAKQIVLPDTRYVTRHSLV